MITFISYITEAISIADKVFVLSKSPATIKNMYEVKLEDKKLPSENRKNPNFNYYYNLIWEDFYNDNK